MGVLFPVAFHTQVTASGIQGRMGTHLVVHVMSGWFKCERRKKILGGHHVETTTVDYLCSNQQNTATPRSHETRFMVTFQTQMTVMETQGWIGASLAQRITSGCVREIFWHCPNRHLQQQTETAYRIPTRRWLSSRQFKEADVFLLT